MTPPTTPQLAQAFLAAAQALGDRMLVELAQRDPAFAEAVGTAVEHGERLVLSLIVGDEPVAELSTRNDYNATKRIATIPLRNGTAQH